MRLEPNVSFAQGEVATQLFLGLDRAGLKGSSCGIPGSRGDCVASGCGCPEDSTADSARSGEKTHHTEPPQSPVPSAGTTDLDKTHQDTTTRITTILKWERDLKGWPFLF